MAWSAPMTAVASSVFTAAQFNTFLRDNLNETAPAKATTAGSHFAVSNVNEISERFSKTASVVTSQTTTSTAYTDLTTAGPAVTADTGPYAFVMVHGAMDNSGTGASRMSFEVTGASAVTAIDLNGVGVFGVAGAGAVVSGLVLLTTLTPGTNVFTAKYRVGSGTGTFLNRRIAVYPL